MYGFKSAFLILLLALLPFIGSAQTNVWEGSQLTPPAEFDNVHVERIHSDERSSTFIIWVKKEVKPHKHAHHTETIVVLEGKAEMHIGEEKRVIRKGDVLMIPAGTPHSVYTISKQALKVVSVQAPEFKGEDRIWIEQ